jgi:hypothetical protein
LSDCVVLRPDSSFPIHEGFHETHRHRHEGRVPRTHPHGIAHRPPTSSPGRLPRARRASRSTMRSDDTRPRPWPTRPRSRPALQDRRARSGTSEAQATQRCLAGRGALVRLSTARDLPGAPCGELGAPRRREPRLGFVRGSVTAERIRFRELRRFTGALARILRGVVRQSHADPRGSLTAVSGVGRGRSALVAFLRSSDPSGPHHRWHSVRP